MNLPVSTQSILYAIARRIGLAPTGDNQNLSPDKAREILGFMDERLKECWELYDFLETTFTEERAFADDYDPTISYSAGAIVWDWCSRSYYTALVPTVGGTVSNPAVWQANTQPPYPRVIPWWQTNHTSIGTCITAWNKNPYSDQNRIPIDFLQGNDGLNFSLGPLTTTIWLHFRIPYTGLALDNWDPTITYNAGDTAFYNTDTYLSVVDNNTNNTPPMKAVGVPPSLSPYDPAVADSNWQQFRIPWPFKQFVTLAAFSDSLIVAGQNEKAPDQLNQAYGAIASEIDKQTIQSAQFTGYSARVV
jgi:hypothetical protein